MPLRAYRLNVTITGAAGAIGRSVCQELLARGHQVKALVLPNEVIPPAIKGVEIVEGNVMEPLTLTAAFAGTEAVLHLAAVLIAKCPETFQAVNVEGTDNVVQAARSAGCRHFVHTSSISVKWKRSTPYSRSKAAAEEIVRDSGLPYTILRPSLAYGPHGGEEFLALKKHLLRLPIVLQIGNGLSRKRPVFIDDLAGGFVAAVNATPEGRTFHLTGPEVITLRDLSRRILQVSGAPRPILPLPVPLCQLGAALVTRLTGNPLWSWDQVRGILEHADESPAEAEQFLGYRPRGLAQGLPQALDADSSSI